MFKGQMTLTSRSMAIQQINVNKIYSIIHWIEIYLLESVIHPSTNWYLGPVVQRVFSYIHCINLCLVDKHLQSVPCYRLDRVYPLDSLIHPYNNKGLGCAKYCESMTWSLIDFTATKKEKMLPCNKSTHQA